MKKAPIWREKKRLSEEVLIWGRLFGTHHYEKNKINPIPEGMGVLHEVHNVRPTFEAYY